MTNVQREYNINVEDAYDGYVDEYEPTHKANTIYPNIVSKLNNNQKMGLIWTIDHFLKKRNISKIVFIYVILLML